MPDNVDLGNAGIIYLAGPYTHPDPGIREERYNIVTAVAAELISSGRVVFSPLTMTHPIDKILAENNATLGSNYWVNFDESFMEFCSEMAVLMIDGWDRSSGVAREIRFFRDRKRPIHFLECNRASEAKFSIIQLENKQAAPG